MTDTFSHILFHTAFHIPLLLSFLYVEKSISISVLLTVVVGTSLVGTFGFNNFAHAHSPTAFLFSHPANIYVFFMIYRSVSSCLRKRGSSTYLPPPLLYHVSLVWLTQW